MAEDTSESPELNQLKEEKTEPVHTDETVSEHPSAPADGQQQQLPQTEAATAVTKVEAGDVQPEEYEANPIIVVPVTRTGAEELDGGDERKLGEDEAADGGTQRGLKRGRKPSDVFSVYVTAVLPGTTSCNAFGINTQLSDHGLGIAPIELIGGARVRSRLPVTWSAADLDTYIRTQFPVLQEYDLMRAGPSKVLEVLGPDTDTPGRLRGILGRSGLYVRPKGTLTDMGISDDVNVKPSPKKNPYMLTPPSGEKRKRGRPVSQLLSIHIVAITKDVTSLTMINFNELKQQGLGIPESEQPRGYAREKSHLPLTWDGRQLHAFIRQLFPALSTFQLLRATSSRHLAVLSGDMAAPRHLKGNLPRSTLYVRATGPLGVVPKKEPRQTRNSKQNEEVDSTFQATNENVDKLKTLLRDNFQSVLSSAITFQKSISILAVIDLVVDKEDTLSFRVDHSWGSTNLEQPAVTTTRSLRYSSKKDTLGVAPFVSKSEPATPGYEEAKSNPQQHPTRVSLPEHTGDTTEEEDSEDEEDKDVDGAEEDGDVDSDTTYVPDGERVAVAPDGLERLSEVEDDEGVEKADPDENVEDNKLGVLSPSTHRGRKPKVTSPRRLDDGVTLRGRGRVRGRGGKRGRPSGFTGYVKRKKFEDLDEPAWDEAKVLEYLSGSHRKLTQQRIDKYGAQFSDALKAVKSRNLNVRAAASTFNLPYGVLWEEVNHSRFQCKQCNKTFAVACHLARHTKSHIVAKSFQCKECAKCFNCEENLKRHLVVHSASMEHVCDICGESFRWKTGLMRHILKHKGERNFVCIICTKGFYTHFDLKDHVKLHSGEKNFVCSACGMQFARSSSLNSHMNCVHTEERQSICPECQKGFKNKHALRRHMRFHTGVTRYVCSVCGEAFKWHTSRKIHMKKHQQHAQDLQHQQQHQQQHQLNPYLGQHHIEQQQEQQQEEQHHPQIAQQILPPPSHQQQYHHDQQQQPQHHHSHQQVAPSSTLNQHQQTLVQEVHAPHEGRVLKEDLEASHILQDLSVSAPLVQEQQPVVVVAGQSAQGLVQAATLGDGHTVYLTLAQQLQPTPVGHIVLN